MASAAAEVPVLLPSVCRAAIASRSLWRAPGANAKLLEVLGRQPREDRVVNIVLAEGRLVSFEAQAPQPLPEVHNFSFNSLPPMIVQRGQSVQRGRGMPKSESGH